MWSILSSMPRPSGRRAVESAHVQIAELGYAICVIENARVVNKLETVVVLINIKVARKNGWQFVLVLFNAVHNHFCTLCASRNAYVIHVQIVIDEFELGSLNLENAPCAYSDACGIPAQAWAVGSGA